MTNLEIDINVLKAAFPQVSDETPKTGEGSAGQAFERAIQKLDRLTDEQVQVGDDEVDAAPEMGKIEAVKAEATYAQSGVLSDDRGAARELPNTNPDIEVDALDNLVEQGVVAADRPSQARSENERPKAQGGPKSSSEHERATLKSQPDIAQTAGATASSASVITLLSGSSEGAVIGQPTLPTPPPSDVRSPTFHSQQVTPTLGVRGSDIAVSAEAPKKRISERSQDTLPPPAANPAAKSATAQPPPPQGDTSKLTVASPRHDFSLAPNDAGSRRSINALSTTPPEASVGQAQAPTNPAPPASSAIATPPLAHATPGATVVRAPLETLVTDDVVRLEATGVSELRNTSAQAPMPHSGSSSQIPVVRQVADALAMNPERPVEVTLSPEELGRVRLLMTTTEVGVSVSVAAERGETLDLIRRHIDDLGRELLGLGYTQVSFSFGSNASDTSEQASGEDQDAPEPSAPTSDTTIKIALTPDTGIDIRL